MVLLFLCYFLVNFLFFSDIEGYTFFHEVLYSTLRNHFRHEIFPHNISTRALRHIFKEEKNFYLKIEVLRFKKVQNIILQFFPIFFFFFKFPLLSNILIILFPL